METLEKVYQFIVDHHVVLLSIAGALFAWFDAKKEYRGYLEKLKEGTETAKEKYLAAKKEAKSRHLYEKAEMAYQFVNKMARTTDTDIDDKAALGIKKALEFLQKAGWGPEDIGNDDKDILLGHFDRLHEAEKKLLEASAAPLASSPPKPGVAG